MSCQRVRSFRGAVLSICLDRPWGCGVVDYVSTNVYEPVVNMPLDVYLHRLFDTRPGCPRVPGFCPPGLPDTHEYDDYGFDVTEN